MGQAGQHGRTGRTGLIIALKRLAGLDEAKGPRGRHALGFQHGGGQHLSHAALEGQSAIAAAGPGRAARALGGKVQQTRRRALCGWGLTKLRIEKAATIAELGIIDPELVAVITHGQGLGLIARQGFKPGKGRHPVGITQPV